MNTGNKRYEDAKKLIPGGTQLLSKRPELYAPQLWPPYATKAKGSAIWDLDKRQFLDMSSMGIGSCVLGYADEEVNEKVVKAITEGSMCSLNFEEEVLLAEKLVEIHPWASTVRFARSGGEALSQAIRIARASTKKERIIFCGYHGWHDWYLAGNLAYDDALKGHLLSGLEPEGVPKALKGSALPFHYNRLDELDSCLASGEIAAIIMEPMRYTLPIEGFLEDVKDRAHANDAILIFDEVTSAFRQNIGGLHQVLGTKPDIAVFAKAISNGFPCAAVIGKAEYMNAAQDTFISSTYWTERIGFTAALATLDAMETRNVPKQLLLNGTTVCNIWKEASKKFDVPITIEGHPALCHFSFESDKEMVLKTILTQQLLQKNILGNTAYYASYAHTDEDLSRYAEGFNFAMRTVAEAYRSDNSESYLTGPVSVSGFTRL